MCREQIVCESFPGRTPLLRIHALADDRHGWWKCRMCREQIVCESFPGRTPLLRIHALAGLVLPWTYPAPAHPCARGIGPSLDVKKPLYAAEVYRSKKQSGRFATLVLSTLVNHYCCNNDDSFNNVLIICINPKESETGQHHPQD